MKSKYLLMICVFVFAYCHSTFASSISQPGVDKLEYNGKRFSEAINQGEPEALLNLIDSDKMAENIAQLISDDLNARDKQDIERGIKIAIKDRFVPSLINMVTSQSGEVVYRRMIRVAGEPRAVLLVDFGDEGMNFLEIVSDRKSGKIIDWYNYITGELVSHSVANAISLMLPEKSNFFTRLIGGVKPDKKVVDVFKKVARYNQVADYAKSFHALGELPEAIRNHRTILALRAGFAQFVSDEEYAKQLSLVDKLYGDQPDVFFLLLDHYYMTEQYDKAIVGLSGLKKRLGNDMALVELEGNLYFTKGDFTNAARLFNELVSERKDYEDGYWALMTVYNSAKQFDKLLTVVAVLNEQFDAEIGPDSFLEDEIYQAFIDSNEYKRWSNDI